MAHYLPVLLVSVTTNSIPDDSSVSTLPRGQVDYLSHDWEEEDVWRSWRNMTRQKNEIANGMRLENASWRTWWKQRNKLKTVTPETLNWLKDSDVTWLYGPLHTAVDWAPPPRPKPDPTSVDDKAPLSAHDRLDLNPGTLAKKPILKYRSISELLTSDLAANPWNTIPGADGDRLESVEEEPACIREDHLGATDNHATRPRPPLLHTKSESHFTRWPNRAYRKDSPPRIIAEDAAASVSSPGSTSRTSSTLTYPSSSDQELAPISAGPVKKKHISFNTFVEQCIAIEKPKSLRDGSESGSATPRSNLFDAYDDGYDEDSEGGMMEDDEDDEPVIFTGETHLVHEPSPDQSFEETDSDSDDEVLEIRTASTPMIRPRSSPGRSSSSSSSSSSSRSRSSGIIPQRYNTIPNSGRNSTIGFRSGPALLRTPSSEKEHMTIAPIAPTILKTKGVGNGSGGEDDDYDYPVGVNEGGKWYTGGTDVPVHLVYVPPLGSNYSMDGGERDTSEDVYHHREVYFSVGTGARRDGQVPTVNIERTPSNEQTSAYFHPPMVASPKAHDGQEEDAYDYFGGPDMGNLGFSEKRRPRRSVRTDDAGKEGPGGVMRYAQGGASSVVGGRSRGPPEVVVSGAGGDEGRSRSRSRSRSKSRTPSPAECTSAPSIPPPSPSVAVPRGNSPHSIVNPVTPPIPSSNSSLLSPPEIATSRGRSSVPVSENQPRGRSSTRGSHSDRERSSSRGTNSPIGSISPEGSSATIAIGAFGVSANGRDLNARKAVSERGRDRTGKRLNDSITVDEPRTSSLGKFGDGRVASSSSGSSTVSAASTASTATPTNSSNTLRISTENISCSGSITPIPASQTTEEETQRSKQPTPVNSPVLTMKRSFPPVAPSQPSPSTTVPLSPKGIVSRNSPSSPTGPRPEDGTLVGRAVGIAGAFLGAIWNGN